MTATTMTVAATPATLRSATVALTATVRTVAGRSITTNPHLRWRPTNPLRTAAQALTAEAVCQAPTNPLRTAAQALTAEAAICTARSMATTPLMQTAALVRTVVTSSAAE